MANQSLVMYIQNSLHQGADINAIRNALLTSGYNTYEIEEAINFVYQRPAEIHHTIHLSKSAIVGIAAVVLALGLGIYLMLMLTQSPKAPAKLLDFATAPIKSTVKAGDAFSYTVELFNMGNSPRYDVSIVSTVFDQNNKAVTRKEDTVAVEKRTSKTMIITLPASAVAGTYSVRSTASYSQGAASSSFDITVLAATNTQLTKPSCSDGIQNQGETNVDCGGPCAACQECGNCDDNDICTTDSCKGSVCTHEKIIPCCGNGVCESGEDGCADCTDQQNPVIDTTPGEDTIDETPTQIIERARQTSLSDANAAGKICSTLRDVIDKDRCFDTIAKTVNQSILCDYITSSANKDACYMHFAMRFDYTVCEKVDNPYLKKSCESLKYIKSAETASS